MKVFLGTVAVLAFLSMGCVEDPPLEVSDEANIQQLVASSGIVRMQPLDGQGEDDGKSVEMPEFWYR